MTQETMTQDTMTEATMTQDTMTEATIAQASPAQESAAPPEPASRPMTQKEQIQEVLRRVHPALDVNDDESLFGQINKDYEEYATMITNYERDIDKAAADGEVRGRNAAIDEHYDNAPVTDGVPALGGANIGCRVHRSSIFDLAAMA